MAKNYYKYHARKLEYYCPVGWVVTSSSLERKVCGSNLGPVKSDTVLPTACPRCNISSDEAELPLAQEHVDKPCQLVTRFAEYSEYNKSFNFDKYSIKGGESSSQFQWFTIAKIELYFFIFFVLILGLRLQRYSTNTKKYPPEKNFWKHWVLFFPPKPQ